MSRSVFPRVGMQAMATAAVPQWWLYSEGHVLAGAIAAVNELSIEAQILLDGARLYGSRHPTRAIAEQELATLRGEYARTGWIDAI